MCIASFIGNDYSKKWSTSPLTPYTQIPTDSLVPDPERFSAILGNPVSRHEFDALKKEVTELHTLLEKAKHFDKDHDEPNCEMEEKIATVKAVGNLLDIDFGDVFDSKVEYSESDVYEPWAVIQYHEVVARFETEALAKTFAEYVVNYSGDKEVDVVRLFEYHGDQLKFGVVEARGESKTLVAVALFEHYEDAQEWAETEVKFYRVVYL